MLEGKGVLASLARSLHLGELTSKLVEVNFVMGIVRLALIVLATVFSAIPLPFTADMSGHRALPLVGHGHLALSSRQRFFPGRKASRVCPILAPLPSRLLTCGFFLTLKKRSGSFVG